MTRILWLLALSCATACTSQEASDQAALRRLFSLPDDVQVVHYEGFPARSGFGQREGLSLVARYQLTHEQMQSWADNATAKGWEPLPLPREVQARMTDFGFEASKDVQDGYYLCQTAGDNVLYVKEPKSCIAVEAPLDLITGVIDTTTGVMAVQVQSRY